MTLDAEISGREDTDPRLHDSDRAQLVLRIVSFTCEVGACEQVVRRSGADVHARECSPAPRRGRHASELAPLAGA
jgi:hypothetical protein